MDAPRSGRAVMEGSGRAHKGKACKGRKGRAGFALPRSGKVWQEGRGKAR